MGLGVANLPQVDATLVADAIVGQAEVLDGAGRPQPHGDVFGTRALDDVPRQVQLRQRHVFAQQRPCGGAVRELRKALRYRGKQRAGHATSYGAEAAAGRGEGQSGRRAPVGHRGCTYAGGSGVAQAVAGQMHGGERVVGTERAGEVEQALVGHVDAIENDGLERLVVLLVQQLRELLQARIAGARIVGHVQPCEGGVHLRKSAWA